MRFHKIKWKLLVVLVFLLIVVFFAIQDIRYCDLMEQQKLVQDPKGNTIPYYSNSINAKSYGQVSKECKYIGDKIHCPDVRHLGESMNRQSMLSIARMHAILDLICKRYNIDYWIFAGSLIGARRNGLMLPWDSDSDIGMMIEDYKKLLKYIRFELPDDIYFQDGSDNPLYRRYSDAKLRDTNSCYGNCLKFNCHWEDGLQIDIYAFRKVNGNPLKIQNYFYKTQFDIVDVYPTKNILYEGILLPAPRNVDKVLEIMFGPDFLQSPNQHKFQCSKGGSMAIPWYSCNHIKNLPKDEQVKILKMGMDHRNPWYWYIG
jgi:LPS biosynthesis protein